MCKSYDLGMMMLGHAKNCVYVYVSRMLAFFEGLNWERGGGGGIVGGKNLFQLLCGCNKVCTVRLGGNQPAQLLYTLAALLRRLTELGSGQGL